MRKSNTMIKSNLLLAVVLLAVLVFAIAFSVFDGNIAVADDELQDIVAPETGFNEVVHYEFKDETNLGKDSLGNYDLVAKNVGIDAVNGGVALKDNGMLYAPALDTVEGDEYKDFSDLVKGSFSISFRAYLRNNSGGGNYLITTGSYGSHFTMNWAYGGFGMNFGNNQNQDFMKDGSKDMLSGAFAWYRVNVIYDESNDKETHQSIIDSLDYGTDDDEQNYYLLFNKNSMHLSDLSNADDKSDMNGAIMVANLLLSM